jgi:predicted NAD/FAD-binding protein
VVVDERWRPTRRQVLGGLAGAVGLAACGASGGGPGAGGGRDADGGRPDAGPDAGPDGGAARPRIGIVGGGMAGVATAWLLDGAYDVVLFEARDVLGGNVRTVEVDVGGRTVAVDAGAQYFHPGPYPTYTRLLAQLGLYAADGSATETRPTPATITVARQGEEHPRLVSPQTPDRSWPLTESWNVPGLAAFAVFARQAQLLHDRDGDWSLSFQDWIDGLPISADAREHLVLPFVASLFSGEVEPTRAFSARAATIFLAEALSAGGFGEITYYTLAHGLGPVIERLAADCTTLTARTGTAVDHVTREGDLFVVSAGGMTDRFDHLVVAAPPTGTLDMLADLAGADAVRAALNGVAFEPAELTLHLDAAYASADPREWSLINTIGNDRFAETSMWLGPVLPPGPDGTQAPVWKSWTAHRDAPPAQPLHVEKYKHLLPTVATLQAQAQLQALQGQGNLWFAGGWTRSYDAQETALLSALDVAAALAPQSARAAGLMPADAASP